MMKVMTRDQFKIAFAGDAGVDATQKWIKETVASVKTQQFNYIEDWVIRFAKSEGCAVSELPARGYWLCYLDDGRLAFCRRQGDLLNTIEVFSTDLKIKEMSMPHPHL